MQYSAEVKIENTDRRQSKKLLKDMSPLIEPKLRESDDNYSIQSGLNNLEIVP